MIKISAETCSKGVRKIKVSGHANSAAYGKDLVCAAVSAVMFGLANALDQLTSSAEVEIGENLITLKADESDETGMTILNAGLIQLETIQETNSDFMSIKKTEV